MIDITGGLTVNGSHTINLAGTAQAGTYELFAYDSSTATADQFAIGSNTAGAGYGYTLDVTGSEIDLVVSSSASSSAWNFSGSGNYGDSTKWDQNIYPNSPGQTATFGNGTTTSITNPPTPTINVAIDGNYTVGSIVFDNSQGTTYNLGHGGAGTGLTLNNNGSGATVSVAAGAGDPIIYANLTLADNATFDVAAGSNLTLSLGGPGVVLNETGGPRSLTKTGAGTLTVDRTSSYTGDTTVSNGTLTVTETGSIGSTGALEIDGNGGNASVVNINANQSVGGLKGTVSGGSAGLNVNGGTLTVNQAANTTFAGGVAVANSATFAKAGGGVLALSGSLALADGSALAVNGGSLKLGVAASSVGTNVTASLSNGGTLELAGPVSALGTANVANRVDIAMNSADTTLVVSGGDQQVGGIDGAGTVQVDAGTSLTANHVVAGALVIGGDATHTATVTIVASDASGDPTASAGFALAGSLGSTTAPATEAASSTSLLTADGSLQSAGAGAATLGGAASARANRAAVRPPCPSRRRSCCSRWPSWRCWHGPRPDG